MPGMDGFELTKKIKTDPRYQDIIVLMLSSNAQRGDAERAKAVGCDAYLTKPIDTQALPGLVAGLLNKNRA